MKPLAGELQDWLLRQFGHAWRCHDRQPLAGELQDWLLRPVPVEEAENIHTYRGVIFGPENGKWQKLRSMVMNDPKMQLWYFCSPPETWTGFPLCGMEGYAAVKDGKIVDFTRTAIS